MHVAGEGASNEGRTDRDNGGSFGKERERKGNPNQAEILTSWSLSTLARLSQSLAEEHQVTRRIIQVQAGKEEDIRRTQLE